MSQRIAFFDFDGTITTKDTFLEFIKYYRGNWRFYLGFLLYSPYLVAYRLGLLPNYTAKQKILTHFFKGEQLSHFQRQCDGFSDTVLPGLIRPKALTEIGKLKQANARIIVVSASAENWIRKWADNNNLELIGTRLQSNNGFISGKIEGKNCYGDEKVRRIEKEITLADFNDIYSYGDSSGDKAMLAIANHAFYKPFR